MTRNTHTTVRYLLWALTLALLTAGAAAPAFASDGALEIHQACVAAGCFPGDAPGFPVELATSGSYILTSNLDVPSEGIDAIEITAASDVHLDLGGFTISGVTTCGPNVGDPCSPAVPSAGVNGGATSGGSVRNGSVRGFGWGVSLRTGRIERITATHNSFIGINPVFGGIVRDCIAVRNGGEGISSTSPAILSGNLSSQNNGTGIAASRSVIRDNAVVANGGSGIFAGGGSVVIGNTVHDNTLDGLASSPLAGFAANVLQGNSGGTPGDQVSGNPVPLDPNLCAGVTPCPP